MDLPDPKRSKLSKKQRLSVFVKHEGRCYLCERIIRPGEVWETEHVLSIGLGGDNSEENLRPAHVECHKVKTAKDVGKMGNGKLFAPKYIENKLKFFPFIKEAVVFGDGKDSIMTFINIDFDAIANWAERRHIPFAGYIDLASKAEVYKMIGECIDKVNVDLADDPVLSHAQIARFLVLHKELDPDDGELTRTRKVRRGFIAEKYAPLLDALYAGKTEQFIETKVKFEDGRDGSISATVRIQDAKSTAEHA